MSEITATTATVSDEYLASVRLYVRNTSTALDAEIKDLILAARGELILGGVLPARAADENDALVKRAVTTYVRAEFGLENEDAEKYRASFKAQKIALALADDYIAESESGEG